MNDNNLPIHDISYGKQVFWIQLEGERILAVCGIEEYNDFALLRSLAVLKHRQSSGIGSKIYKHVVEECSKNNIARLFLLTTTASGFFSKYGWTSISRKAVPLVIQESEEFKSICPVNADCMILNVNKA